MAIFNIHINLVWKNPPLKFKHLVNVAVEVEYNAILYWVNDNSFYSRDAKVLNEQ